MTNLLTILLTAIAIATLLNVLLKRINIPTIIGYIFTGSIIGMAFGIHAHGNVELEHIAEFGIVFLMFSIGLELSISELKAMKKELSIYGLLQVMLTGGVLSLAAQFLFDIEPKASIIIGLGLSLSSTAIVLKLFNETGEIKTSYGRTAKGVLIFQDIALIPILLMITIFTNDDKSLSALLTETAINAALTLSILFVIGKYVLKHFFKIISNANSKEIYMGSILLTVVGSSYLAHHFGFSYTLGAFIAGVMIADTMYKYQIEADLIPFRDLLLGVFFVTIGMQINFHIIQENILIILGLLSAIMLIKTLVVFVVLRFFIPGKDALKAGLSLAQVGEAALVVFSLVLSSRLLDADYVQIVIVTIVFSMILTPFILGNMDILVRPFFKKETFAEVVTQENILDDHIILCGYGSFGQSVSEKLTLEKIDHQIITEQTESYVKARQEGKNVFFGDPADRILLESLQVRNAMSVIVALDDLEHLERVCASVNLIDPKISIVARVQRREDLEALKEFNIKSVLDSNDEISSYLVDDIVKSRLLAQETTELQHLNMYDRKDPDNAIELVNLEQIRLLDIISKSFNGIREGKDIMVIKAYHDSFAVLSEIIRGVITDLTSSGTLSATQYSRINILLSNQHMFEEANTSLKKLGRELYSLESNAKGQIFSNIVVEGLDTILLSLKDVAADYDEDDMMLLKIMTSSDSRGIEKIRSAYLSGEDDFDKSGKMLLLSATNLTERLILLFGEIGHNYNKFMSEKENEKVDS